MALPQRLAAFWGGRHVEPTVMKQGPVQGGVGVRDPVLWGGGGATFNLMLGREVAAATLETGPREPNRTLDFGRRREEGTLG